MAVKLDMSKAYDRVEWVYLENVMRKMGFSKKWIGLIMVCIKTVTYSILVNGEPQGLIQPTRGIRQGDPLSPFLFSLCTEGLHGLIQHSLRVEELKGLSICQNDPQLTHLLFADDSLLFCRATIEECRKIMEILEIYEVGSGQKVNKNKTAIFFSKSTLEGTKAEIKEAMGLQEIVHYDKYLGLSSLVGRNKKESFNFIKEKGPMLGGVFYMGEMYYVEDVGGGWEMGELCTFGRAHGCHRNTQPRTYTSKSGYRFLKSKEDTSEVSIQLMEDRELWRGIWSLQVLNKVKNFTWRACRNSLPTKGNLVRQTIIENPLCDWCSCANELALHALWSCGELDVVWEDLTLWSCRNTLSFVTFKELLSWLIKHQHHLELFAVTAWSIWIQRNQVRLNKPSCSSHSITSLAKECLWEFQAVNLHPPSIRTVHSSVQK
ncbi:uncharacterized protein LOC142639779 [Castanea sativa]|uniref:uncharacterized protein LOC142639779 n=1 Tax=Castanea sativa TaxID=21020 RepID=UPI003F653220